MFDFGIILLSEKGLSLIFKTLCFEEITLNLFFLFAERLNNKLFLTVFCEEDLKVDILLFSNDDKLFGFISLVKRFNSSENKI